jgi:hypothetical protein
MKRYIPLLVSLLLIVIVFVLAAGLAVAKPKFPVSHLTQTICSRGAPEKMWFDEKTGHGRNMPEHIKSESSDMRFVGENLSTVNWNVNFTTMKGVSWGDFDLYNSNGVDGWRGTWQGKIYPASPPVVTIDEMPIWLFDGGGQGHGLGSYHGLQEHFDIHQSVFVYDKVDDVPEEIPCVTGETNDGQVYVLQNDVTAYVTGQAK